MSYRTYYSNSHEEDSPKLKSPMPWIGIYVAAASLALCLGMAADTFNGFRSKRLWFPSKISALNAASLTFLAIAMKMPLDLSTPMPTSTDQLAKLTSTALMSIVMSKFIPSLGPMDDKELFTNVTALGVLVITVTGNICIELGTGLIRHLIVEHALLMFLMLACFVILSSSALIVPSTKKHLDLKYKSRKPRKFTVGELTTYVQKHWMMAVTASPQFVMARAVTCSASEAICFLVALILVEAELRLLLGFSSPGFKGRSDYKWSTIFILLIQTAGVVVGTIAPVVKWYAIKFQHSKKTGKEYSALFKTENYWTEKLEEQKKSYLDLRLRRRGTFRKLVQGTKNATLCFCIKVQILIVLVCKLEWHIFFCFISQFFSCCQYCKKRGVISTPETSNNPTNTKSKPSTSDAPNNPTCNTSKPSASGVSNNPPGTKSKPNRNNYPRHYALYLEAEEKIPERILENIDAAFHCFIKMGRKNKPKKLMELLQEYTKVTGRMEFDSNCVSSPNSQQRHDCWAMPVVTLTSIAIAISTNNNKLISTNSDELVKSVSEGLLYVNRVENSMDSDGKVMNIRNAANTVWSGVEIHGKWLGKDLRNMARNKTSRETLEELANVAENTVKEFKAAENGGSNQEDPLNWPDEVIAADSMHRIGTILQSNGGSYGQTDGELFQKLVALIARILSACFTNLPHVITRECFSSPIENRESSVQHAAQLLGETEEILKAVEKYDALRYPYPGEEAYIDGWRTKIKKKSPLVFLPPPNNDTDTSGQRNG